MEILIILMILGVILALMTAIGHGIWVLLRGIIRSLFAPAAYAEQPPDVARCSSCKAELSNRTIYCGKCGSRQTTGIVAELLKDLASTERQLERFRRAGAIKDDVFEDFKTKIQAERTRLNNRATGSPVTPSPAPDAQPAYQQQPDSVTKPSFAGTASAVPPSVVVPENGDSASVVNIQDQTIEAYNSAYRFADETPAPVLATNWTESSASAEEPPPPSEPRRPFTEVLNAFMEESNIRWGEIIGGLLIIGGSTALVVSLWAQISAIPVLKFLIFTTVTAAFFGVGLYTEHRWKLPTTSRGILTIATLLVPLNFLAIAAVSGANLPQGSLVILSELVAPAVFLCLVFFAGRVISPKWPHLLVAGVLGSSIGQLLIRHFAAPENSPGLRVILGAFPIVCFAVAVGWMLRIAMDDNEIDENEVIAIFVSLGSLTFAAVLPFGLLLYKSGPVSMSMMYLAPLVSLAGVPLLFSGTLLWKRLSPAELPASRVAGTSIGLIGLAIVLSGMILAWPNPTSIVPAALLNFAVLTVLAILLELPLAHLPAALCFSLAYVVFYHVVAGHISWQNLRVVSLLEVSDSISTGHALTHLFLPLVVVSTWLTKKRGNDSVWYLVAACTVGLVSLFFLTLYGFNEAGDPHALWLSYLVYAVGAFFVAQQFRLKAFSWIGSLLLLFSFYQVLGPWLGRPFPWQTALLVHAAACALFAIIAPQIGERFTAAVRGPLNKSALISSFAALLCLLQANRWETTDMQAERVFWMAGVWLALLWLNRDRRLFTVFQIALTAGVILSIKAALQQYDWYSYLPHAFLHPVALQIQGTALVLLSLVWVGVRFGLTRFRARRSENSPEDWTADADRLLTDRFAVDRLVIWIVLGGLALLTFYGAFSGVKQELTARGSGTPTWDIVGFPHQYALGTGGWIVLGLLVIVMLANFSQRRRASYFLGAVGALALTAPLLAGLWETQIATASAWRWLATIFLVAASLPVWFRERWRLENLVENFGWEGLRQVETLRRLRVLLLAATLIPLLVLTAYPAFRAIYYMPVHGPGSGIFYALGDTVSYSLPLVIVALALIAYAARERLVSYAFSAGLLFNLTISMAFLLSVVAVHGNMDRVVLAHVVQLNVIVATLYSILWLSVRDRWAAQLNDRSAGLAEQLLRVQLGMAIGGIALVLLPAVVHLIVIPDLAGAGTAATSGVYGWLAFVLTVSAAALFTKSYKRPISPDVLFGFLVVMSCLVTFSSASIRLSGWSQYHVLMFALAAVAWLMCSLQSWHGRLARVAADPHGRDARATDPHGRDARATATSEWSWNTTLFSSLLGAVVVLLALRAVYQDPYGAWWSIVAIVAISALAAALNWQTLRHEYLFATGLLFNLAASLWCLKLRPGLLSADLNFVLVNVIAGCSIAILCLWLDLRARRLRESRQTESEAPFAAEAILTTFHHLAALGAMALMVFVTLALLGEGPGEPAQFSATLGWLALGSVAALMFACLWDRRAKYAMACLYLIGLIAAAMTLGHAHLSVRKLGWAGLMVLAIYSVASGLLWRRRSLIIGWADRLKIPRHIDLNADALKWLQSFTAILVFVVGILGYWVVLGFHDWPMRITAGLAVMVKAFALILVAPVADRQGWRKTSFGVLVVGLALFGWAWLIPEVTGTWLNRAVILMVEMFAIVALFGLELDKALEREPDWSRAVRECAPWLTAAGILSLFFVLATEVYYRIEFGVARVKPLALVTVGLTLLGATAVCILFALSPRHDPLSLSEPRRRRYVYAAELMLALFFLHVRLTMPWLFTGFFERYWPLVVVALAYAGVGVSELLRRRNVLVLAHPIERTGVFLPLLPVLGFWVTHSEVDYSVLLFIVGGLYGLVAILRRSFGFGMLAVLAGNGGLWYLWHRTSDYGFLQHPQLWLIPVAISVLIAAHLNREAFSEDQMTGVRYLALIVIYVSSTSDIFVNGVAHSPWLPLILAALALAGVFGGIMLRIRAFLLLGSVFLLLAITTMIYYAWVNFGWTWLWWVATIVTGASILAMFAVFEKKRNEVLRVVEGLKEWER